MPETTKPSLQTLPSPPTLYANRPTVWFSLLASVKVKEEKCGGRGWRKLIFTEQLLCAKLYLQAFPLVFLFNFNMKICGLVQG